MTSRRSRGDGGLHWDAARERWIASVTVGYSPAGKRIVKRGSGRTKTEAKNKLKEIIRDYDDGLASTPHSYTVGQAVTDWLAYGLSGRDASTVETRRILATQHVIPALGARKLAKLSAEDVDQWLAEKARTLSTRTLRDVRAILSRSIARAQARDQVKRNVVLLCDTPVGQIGRPSKALTLPEAEALLAASEDSTIGAYVVLSLLTGARTEELRALTWAHVNLDVTPPHIMVWRSVRVGGDTKTRKSRRTLALPQRCVDVLQAQKVRQAAARRLAGARWESNDLVFASEVGTALDAANVRRGFRRIATTAGLPAKDWTPRELRHSFVSLLSDDGVPIEQISRLVGHSGTSVTELVYRKQIRPVVEDGATVMDRIFPRASG
ncbi:tyrosine-type recombinase/integrase [Pseudonocardia sp. KRD-184]|uniref:Tyrosine-type recombinase/integrase n=1 Tax=Pseudonocardia oceani TaxID=2792013 RepID=A0ABS6U8K6_9PSEU|nr:tyrosine-type recombinase/integrase [Pseudonocardia oceani]MBW0097753.1 tyrosine-type recombinase/integrase [Pseudonocardia oceani]MBW0108565.1 tyrosine-type recombinase/integrase [Pseudonocardia oceani]MBW0122331.1 tyrosine-type recombinase/integrase [Pseudonocardia oceani]MBW0128581.1 tyrosine-type recombinase/integrase [Pseudonocardia oceani]